jgi:hypothetical protein
MPTALFGMYHRGLRERAILEDITGGLTLPRGWERATIAEKDARWSKTVERATEGAPSLANHKAMEW